MQQVSSCHEKQMIIVHNDGDLKQKTTVRSVTKIPHTSQNLPVARSAQKATVKAPALRKYSSNETVGGCQDCLTPPDKRENIALFCADIHDMQPTWSDIVQDQTQVSPHVQHGHAPASCTL